MCSLGVSRSRVRSKVKPLGINKRAVVCGSRKRAKGLKIRVEEEEERNNNGWGGVVVSLLPKVLPSRGDFYTE